MTNLKLLLLGAALTYAAFMFGQTVPRDLSSKPQGGIFSVPRPEMATRVFHLKGEQYMSLLTAQDAEGGCAWEPSLPLPFSLERAEETARKELRKLTRDEIRWVFSEFSMSRLRGLNGEVWYFAMTLNPVPPLGEETSDFFTVLMNTSGKPGWIGHYNSDRKR